MSTAKQFIGTSLVELSSSGTLPSDPPAGYTSWDVNGNVTSTRQLTADELASFLAEDAATSVAVNQTALLQASANALATNATYQAIGTPTQAQAVAQVAALTRQVNALIRLAANQLTSTSGT